MTKRKITIDFINKYFAKGLKDGKITEEAKTEWLAFVREKYAGGKTLKATNEIKAHFIELYFPQLNDEDVGTGDFI